jgi:hypothetical protein
VVSTATIQQVNEVGITHWHPPILVPRATSGKCRSALDAREGETIAVGGGGHPAPAGTECAEINEWTWYVMGAVTKK